MRICYVTTYNPCLGELGGASWVDQQFLQHLRAKHEVTVFPVVDPSAENSIPLEIRRKPVTLAKTALYMLLRSKPYQAAKFQMSRHWSARADDLARAATSYDLVLTSQWPGLLLAADGGAAVDIHLAHNVDYIIAEEHSPLPLRILRDASRMRSLERATLRIPQRIVTLSGTDAERLQADGLRADHVRIPQRSVVGSASATRAIGFIGKLSWPPNQRALNELVQRVMPEVRRVMLDRSPGLVLAGRGTEPLHNLEGVTSLGVIDSVEEFYKRVDCVVVPRMGTVTGISVKVLEALQYGVTVIAPEQLLQDAAAEGSVLPANSAAEVVEQVVRFYSDMAMPAAVPSLARHLVDIDSVIEEGRLGDRTDKN